MAFLRFSKKKITKANKKEMYFDDLDYFHDNNDNEEEEWNESLLDDPKTCLDVPKPCLDVNNTPNVPPLKCHQRTIIHIDIDCF